MIGVGEMVVVGGVLVLVFGASQIPKVARSVGEGLKELKRSVREAKDIDLEVRDEGHTTKQ